MTHTQDPGVLERTRVGLRNLAQDHDLLDLDVSVTAKPLTPVEAIGTPGRRDFPILVGKERVIEARIAGARGHAFTDSPREFLGTLGEVMDLPFDSNQHRAIFTATLNAALGHLGLVTATVHCRDNEPETCALEIASQIRERWNPGEVGLIGLNPAIAERLAEAFGPAHLRITDLDRDNIGQERFGVEIWDGTTRTEALIERSDIIVFTGTTLINDTFDAIWARIHTRSKIPLVYGMTAAGASHLIGFDRLCPCGHSGA
jgi:Putative heavy-metal chelation